MKKIPVWLNQIFEPLGSLKMAVILLLTLAAVLTVGTFLESYYSRNVAYTMIYGATWFHLLLLFLAVNILAAAINRMPFQKRLTGFYISHLGLLILLGGSLLSLLMGIDGTLTLPPREFNQTVRLEEQVLYTQVPGVGTFQKSLPRTIKNRNLDEEVVLPHTDQVAFTIRRFLPYAKEEIRYRPISEYGASGVEFSLFSPQGFSSETLSSPPSDFSEDAQLGPLHVFFLGTLGDKCHLSPAKGEYLLVGQNECHTFHGPTPPKKKISVLPTFQISSAELGLREAHFRAETPAGDFLFLPALSAWPLKTTRGPDGAEAIVPDFGAAYRIYRHEDLLRGKTVILYQQDRRLFAEIFDLPNPVKRLELSTPGGNEVTLPWMGLRLKIEQWEPASLPYRTYVATKPTPGDENRLSALALEVKGLIHWITSNGQGFPIALAHGAPSSNPHGGMAMAQVFLGFRTFELPWAFRLERFKMDTDPGTTSPASYESFVNVRDPKFESPENAHIYMNNPLKKGKYTFYQASYFPVGPNAYGSVLQVNYDPGRIPKYFGSLIIVLGTAIHFTIRRARKR